MKKANAWLEGGSEYIMTEHSWGLWMIQKDVLDKTSTFYPSLKRLSKMITKDAYGMTTI